MVRDTPTALVVVDVEGTVLVANPSARRLLTMARSGRSLTALMDDSDASRVHEYLESLFRGSSRSVHLERLRLRGKHDTWVSLDGRSVRFIAGFRGAVLAVQNITPWVEQVAELTVRSSTDALTGLRNRRVLDEEATRTHRECDGALFVVLDIDRFKEVNDGHGHAFGDGVLVQVGHRLKALASDSATVFRLGGDEFALLFPEGGEALAHDLVTRLQEINRQPFLVHGQNVAITFSAGVALRGGHSSHEWIARADAALYRAKGQPGAVVIWDEEFRDWRSRRLDLEAELEELRSEVSRLTETTRTDYLTNLPNVRALYQDLDALLASSPSGEVGLVFIDLDMFGSVNKARGDEVGDEVLARVAQVFQSSCRESDVVYRKGGEEFVVVLPGAGPGQARDVAERFRSRLAAASIPHKGRPDMPVVTLSAGVASGRLSSAEAVDELMRSAATRMLRAKESGRNRVVDRGA